MAIRCWQLQTGNRIHMYFWRCCIVRLVFVNSTDGLPYGSWSMKKNIRMTVTYESNFGNSPFFVRNFIVPFGPSLSLDAKHASSLFSLDSFSVHTRILTAWRTSINILLLSSLLFNPFMLLWKYSVVPLTRFLPNQYCLCKLICLLMVLTLFDILTGWFLINSWILHWQACV